VLTARLVTAEVQAQAERLRHRPVLTARLVTAEAEAAHRLPEVSKQQGRAVRWFVLPVNMLTKAARAAKAASGNVPLTEYVSVDKERTK
jgi:hypothetical protein